MAMGHDCLILCLIGLLSICNANFSGVYDLTQFRISVSDSEISVVHHSNIDRTVWQAHTHEFLQLAFIEDIIDYKKGFFGIKENLKHLFPCSISTLVEISNTQVSFDGECTVRTDTAVHITSLRVVFIQSDVNKDRTLSIHISMNDVLHIYDNLVPQVYLSYEPVDDNEQYYGLGTQYTVWGFRGHKVPIYSQEQGCGRGKAIISKVIDTIQPHVSGDIYTSYAPVAHYISTASRSLYLENYEYSLFDFCSSDKNTISVRVNSTYMAASIIAAENMIDVIHEYTKHSGRMKPLPDWVGEGAIVATVGGTDEVRRKMDILQTFDKEMPIASLFIQDWSGYHDFGNRIGVQWNWQLDTKYYHHFDKLIADMGSQNIRILTYINPDLQNISTTSLYQEAYEKRYLVNADINESGLYVGLLDFSQHTAREWMKQVIKKNILSAGVYGFMSDLGEYFPLNDLPPSNNRDIQMTPAQLHNYATFLFQDVVKEVLQENPEEDYVSFFRCGTSISPRAAQLFWVGDQMTTWDKYDGIKTVVTSILASGLSGFALNHCDIGGYQGLAKWGLKLYMRTTELFERWCELAAFTVMYRSHEGSHPLYHKQFYSNQKTLTAFSKFAKVFISWTFYRKMLMKEAELTGLPVMRPLFLHFPADKTVYDLHFQFMVGEEIMVAPVLDNNHRTVKLYLPQIPESNWIHVWTGEVIPGGTWLKISAPIGQPGVFIRQGSDIGNTFVNNLREHGFVSD